MPVRNYRVHSFNLFSERIEIAGMSGPHNWGDDADIDRGLSALREQKIDVIIGLHDEHDFTELCEAAGFVYHHIPIADFVLEPISPKIYDQIFALVKSATAVGKKIAIHCGEGDGRSGTALASLKLRELLERKVQVSDVVLWDAPDESTQVRIGMRGELGSFTSCTPLVKQAIEELRALRRADDENGIHSVETRNDVVTLMNYEQHLRTLLKNTEQFKLKLAFLGLTVDQQEEIFNIVYGNVEYYELENLFLLPITLFTEAHRDLILTALNSRFELLQDEQRDKIAIELFMLVDLTLSEGQYSIVQNIVARHYRTILHDARLVYDFLNCNPDQISVKQRDFFLRTVHDRLSQLFNTGTKLFMVFNLNTDKLSLEQRQIILESIPAQLSSIIKNGKEFLRLFSLSMEQLNFAQRQLIFNSVKSQLSVWMQEDLLMKRLFSLSVDQFSESQRALLQDDRDRHDQLAVAASEAKKRYGFYAIESKEQDSNMTQELFDGAKIDGAKNSTLGVQG